MNEFSYKGVHLKSENPCFIENSERDSEVRLEKEGEGRGGSIFEVEFLSFSDPFVLWISMNEFSRKGIHSNSGILVFIEYLLQMQ